MKWKLASLIILGIFFSVIVVANIWDYNPSGSDPSLVGYWKFDGNALDETGVNNGTIVGATYTNKGKFSGAYEFDGAGDYISVTPISSINKSLSFSISLWFNSRGANSVILNHNIATNNVFGISTTTNGAVFAGIYDGSYIFKKSSGTNVLNTWHHVTVTFDGNSDFNLYVDSILQVGTSQPTLATAVGFKIGSYSTGAGYFFNGTIDEVRIYNRSLSASEVLELYNESKVSHTLEVYGSGDMGLTNMTGNVLWMDLEYYNSTTVLDKSGEGNNGTITGATYTSAGKYGGAYEFNGSGNYIDTASTTIFSVPAITVSAWVNADSVGEGVTHASDTIVQRYNPTTYGWKLGINNNGKPAWVYYNGAGCLSDVVTSSGASIVGSWHHIVSIRNATNLELFVDGISVGTDNTKCSALTTSEPVRIGRWKDVDSHFDFNGTIDEVMIWNRTLSSSEILQLYNQSLASHSIILKGSPTQSLLNDPSLVSKWSLDYFNGTTVRDYKGKNNGSIVGATYTNKGKFEGAYEFDGDDKITTSNTINLTVFTINAWINQKSAGTNSYCTVFSNAASIYDEIWMTTQGGTTAHVRLDGTISSVASAFTLNKWQMYTFMYNGTNAIYYIDGVFKSSIVSTPDAPLGRVPTVARIGGSASNQFFCNGTIDELMIFNRSLSAEEISSLYNQSLTSNKFIIRGSPSAI